jgi:hypothetical protein
MLAQYLLELVTLIEHPQVEIAATLGVNRSAIHQWLHETYPIPPAKRAPLVATILISADTYIAFQEGFFHRKGGRNRPDPQRQARVERVKELIKLCKLELLEEQGQGPTRSINEVLAELVAYRDMSEEELRKPANRAQLQQLTASLARHVDLLCQLEALRERKAQEKHDVDK